MHNFATTFTYFSIKMENNPTTDRNELVTQNMGYVVTLARQYNSDILSVNDLVNEGCIGMMKAAEKYDPSRGKPFVTFAAPYVRHSIEEAITRTTGQAPVLSTDESLPIGSNNNYTLLNVLEDKGAPKADATIEENELSDDLAHAVNLLDERQHAVIKRLYGIDCQRMTMAEAATELGLTRERVRQIRNKALRKLHKVKRER